MAAAENSEKAVDIAAAMQTVPATGEDWLVVAGVLLCLLGAAVLMILRRHLGLQAVLAIAVLALSSLANLLLLRKVLSEGPVVITMGNWLPPFGITFAADGLGTLLALTSCLVALAGAVYALRDINRGARLFGFYPLLLIMMAGVMGAFLTGDIFNLYVWFEVLLIASFGLIVYGNRRIQLDGAMKYAILNFLATTLFLVATGYLYGVSGTLNMADLSAKLGDAPDGAPLGAIAILYLVAFGMKAAAFPLNFWLPASYHTPNIVVGAVFAGLLTKVGVYALIRTFTTIMPSDTAHVHQALLVVAIATMLIGALGALAQSDLRRLLGFLVVSGIGYMLLGLAFSSEIGLGGALFYAVHSMVIMTVFYLMAGVVFRRSGSYMLQKIGGLYGQAPFTAALFLVCVLALSGLPPFSGFWPKLMLIRAGLEAQSYIAVATVLLAGFITTIALGRAWIFCFWRNGPEGAPEGEAATLQPMAWQAHIVFFLPVVALLALVVFFGLWPQPLMAALDPGVEGLLQPAGYIQSVLGGN